MKLEKKSILSGVLALLLTVVACGGDEPAVEPQGDLDAGSDASNADSEVADSDSADAAEPACETNLLDLDAPPRERLSEYCFFGGETAAHLPNDDVFPYDVNATLFADDTLKFRFIALPEGTSIDFASEERWSWPVGATLIKTFYYPVDAARPGGERRILETRLLVNRGEEGWDAFTYAWDDAQQDAVFTRLGSWVEVDRTDDAGEAVSTRYRIPDQNSCKNCHAQDDITVPLGPRTWQMNKEYPYPGGAQNQLTALAERGWLTGFDGDVIAAPALARPHEEGDLDARARSYLEANCAHCHNPRGAGGPSGLDLSWQADEPRDYGVCKRPVAAGEGSGGLFYDIVPGQPESSILVFRMASEDPGFKMPELPTLTSHEEGVELVSDWISAMEPAGCPE